MGVGELGMANTTPAAAIVSVLTGSDAQEVVGIGANLPLAKVGNKVEVVRRAIAVNQPDPNDGLDRTEQSRWFRSAGDDRCHAGGGVLWAAGGAGWLSLLRGGRWRRVR
ncbi:nicotinate-nucleotide--dimethylbenzimidazole phosphoribosyltransferase [Klebsiella pneumoniae]|uniref:Nicotinate-nucleotide--dimethylbenzimidazole phosphoribosyltransferase n=1 Tax=Klebsiella pneumoniae TaxID=573 RepID=A0A2X1QET7_KLEPN|nr:nicotinate-nucleotide--dimethylbenzimidazole phosphoribosyltransferase [Klebsiella pneumoniae]